MSELYELVFSFRKAIEEAVSDRRFEHKNRMSGFPRGCCDDACDLLGMYLSENGIDTMQVFGTFRDSIPEHIQDHAWLLMSDKTIIIDITGDQFSDRRELLYYDTPVYVGREDALHRKFKDRRYHENFDFGRPESSRQILFMTMYKTILEYL